MILAGRRINDNMGRFVVEKTVKMMIKSSQNIKNARVGVLGLTFKEDCPDLRNTRVIDIVSELEDFGAEIRVHDPVADTEEARNYYGVDLRPWEDMTDLGALIIAVPHQQYRGMAVSDFIACLNAKGCLVDVKSMLDAHAVHQAGINFWRL